MSIPALPEHRSFISFDHVWVREVVFQDFDDDFSSPGGSGDSRVRLEIAVRRDPNSRTAHVRLKAVVEGNEGSGPFAKLSAVVEGAFTLSDGVNDDRLEQFTSQQAPVLLLPYLRATLSSLTAQSRSGAFVLPPINMVQVIESMAANRASVPDITGNR